MKKLLFLILFFLIIHPTNAFADQLGISISPALITIKTDGKNEVNREINITNKTNHNVSYGITLVPFQASQLKNGEPSLKNKIDQDYNKLFQSTAITDDDITITKVDLAPQEVKTLKLTLNSSGLTNKDYYFSVIFTSISNDEAEDTTRTSINQAFGINVLLSYGSGNMPNGAITNFSTSKIVGNGPVKFNVDIKNNSNSFMSPSGEIRIKNMFGQTIGKVDLMPINVLAGSERTFQNTLWNEKFLLGFYNAKVQISLSPTGPVLEKELNFVAFPIKYLVQTLIAGIIIAYLLIRLIKRRK